jgi:hypothetical protein
MHPVQEAQKANVLLQHCISAYPRVGNCASQVQQRGGRPKTKNGRISMRQIAKNKKQKGEAETNAKIKMNHQLLIPMMMILKVMTMMIKILRIGRERAGRGMLGRVMMMIMRLILNKNNSNQTQKLQRRKLSLMWRILLQLISPFPFFMTLGNGNTFSTYSNNALHTYTPRITSF